MSLCFLLNQWTPGSAPPTYSSYTWAWTLLQINTAHITWEWLKATCWFHTVSLPGRLWIIRSSFTFDLSADQSFLAQLVPVQTCSVPEIIGKMQTLFWVNHTQAGVNFGSLIVFRLIRETTVSLCAACKMSNGVMPSHWVKNVNSLKCT